MGNFFAELRRRHIYRVATVYAIAAWVLLQLVNHLAPLLHLADRARTFFLSALLVGFPVALTLAWVHQRAPSDGTPIPSADISAKFEQALIFHRRGRLEKAEVLYRAVLAQAPKHFDALHMLGIIAYEKGQHAAAVALIERAIAINPNLAAAHFNRGGLLQALRRLEQALASYDRAVQLKPDYAEAFNDRGNVLFDLTRLDEALANYDRAIALKPDYAEAFNNRGTALRNLKRPNEALASYDRAVQLKPDYAEAFYNRGNLLLDLKRPDEALASYNRAVQLKPDYAEAFYNRGNLLLDLERPGEALASYDSVLHLKPDFAAALNNRANALLDLKRPDEALASCDCAVQLKPDYAEAFNNRGNVLLNLKRLDEALASYDRAVQLKPDYAEAFYNRGSALRDLKRPDEALASYDRAVRLKPDYAEAFNNRGNLLRDPLKRLDEALESFGRALQLKPDFATARYNSGIVELLAGRYREGWADYEWRWDAETDPQERPKIDAPVWQGENLAGYRIAIYSEQGLGDIIQFARYLPLLLQRGAKVTFLAPARLIRLLRPVTSQIEVVTSIDEREHFDFQCALMGLPLRFGTEFSSIPNTVPYLNAEENLASSWREKIADRGFKIGIAWQGSLILEERGKKGRSIPLADFFPLAQVPGVRLISLQKGDGVNQLASLPAGLNVETLGDEFDSGPDAFIDTAAVMSNLNLVITSDTSIAHLAGALGCPTWVALKYVPEWRWLLDREDSPWYPTMRLFRQETEGEWKFVFTKIAQELRSYPLAR